MKTKEEIEYLAANLANPNVCKSTNWIEGYTQCQEDMIDKNTWTFEEILDACYPTLGRGGDWSQIAIRLKEQKNKQD